MYKKTLLSLAVASSLGLTGCFESAGSGAGNADPDYQIPDTTIDTSLVRPAFDPIITSPTFSVPSGFDLVYLLGAGQSANYDFTGLSGGTDPASTAINDLAGTSTTASIDIPFNGALDETTAVLGDSVHLVPINMNSLAPGTIDNIELTANPSFINLPTAANPTANPYDLTKLGSQNVRVEVISLDGGTDNVLRITPLEPLASQTKYLVLITDGLKAADGSSTAQSVPYQNTIGDGPLFNSFATIRSLLNGAVSLAQGYQGIAGNTDGITLAYTMTTENTRTVFDAITSPATYLQTLGEQVVLYSALGVAREILESRATEFQTVNASQAFAAVADALSGSPEDLEIAQAVGQAVGPYISDPSLAQTVVGSAVSGLPFPKPGSTKFYSSTTDTANNLAAIAGSQNTMLIGAAANVTVTEGAIELPYYLDLPGSAGAGLVSGAWRGSETLEATMNTTIDTLKGANPTLRNFEFPRDTDDTFNVTQYMPFPEEKAKVVAPVVAFYPNNAICDGSISDVVIFQHGITVDRSVATIPAINIVDQRLGAGACVAVVAIDQPLHGLGGSTVGRVPGLTPATYIDEADFPNADYVGERHFMYSDKGSLVPELQTDITDVSSGSLFLNLLSFPTARDNNRQGVMDLLNLATTINSGGFDLDGDGTRFVATDLQGATFHFVGHSLGGITGTVFSTLSTDPVLRGSYAGIPGVSALYPALASVSLMNTGGQLTRLVENSQSFGPTVLGALNDLAPQGSAAFESFLNVFQATVDGADPANYGRALGANSVSEDFGLLISEVVGDLTVPNEANENPAQLGNFAGAQSAPLAGTEPLMALVDLGAGGTLLNTAEANGLQLISSNAPNTVAPTARVASFYTGTDPCTQANHGTFVAPAVPANPQDPICPNGSNTSVAFADMIGEVIGNITAKTVPVTNSGALGDSPTIDSALDQN
jgi:hypothetical protein